MPKERSRLPLPGALSPPPASSDGLTGPAAAVCHEAGADGRRVNSSIAEIWEESSVFILNENPVQFPL